MALAESIYFMSLKIFFLIPKILKTKTKKQLPLKHLSLLFPFLICDMYTYDHMYL